MAAVVKKLLSDPRADFDETEFIVGISRGGLFPAMVVATALMRPFAAAYIDKEDNVYFDRRSWIGGKKILLVDDIVRTGKTMGKIRSLLFKNGAAEVKTFTPYYLENAAIYPDHGKKIPDDPVFPWDER